MYAFLSYQTEDKAVAGRIKDLLSGMDIPSFLAHEDIDVSDEWPAKILKEIGKADLFVAILSKNYYESCWCSQESGIAAFRKKMIVLPLSIDGSLPKGFLGNIQATKIDPDHPRQCDLLPGIARCNISFAIDSIINIIGSSKGYRNAESNFELILPYLQKASDDQVVRLLKKASENEEVYDAARCAGKYLPHLLKSHGHLLDAETREFLKNTCARWS
ncbi:MAG: toll/interleukin-1 receptor domain-containing protein [Candidatus Binataceae bacterium]|jgi:hypothetical protein